MCALKITLTQLEFRLQSLIEGGARRLLPGRPLPPDLAGRLVAAMHAAIRPGPGGEPQAPNLYILQLPPAQAEALGGDQAFLDELARDLRLAARDAGIIFSGPTALRLSPAPELAPGELRVIAQDSLEGLTPTTGLDVTTLGAGEAPPRNAFLIVDGLQIFPLQQAVINIGRRPDNHLVIDDPRVSRLHAQLRLVRGHYVIFDLDSTGGTCVNGQRIRQQTLSPGDVISFSGLPLVYGQDEASSPDTQEYLPSP
jgi:hypothetical protein